MNAKELLGNTWGYVKQAVGYSGGASREKLQEVLVTEDPTQGYHANRFYDSSLLVNQLPLYTLFTGRMMVDSDPIVEFALNVRNAALMVAEVEIKAKNGRVQEWLDAQWNTIWELNRRQIVATKKWGFAGLQPTYRMNPTTKLLDIDGLKDFAPEDVRALESGGKQVGFRVKDRKLFGPRALWLTFNTEYGSPYGKGSLRRMYPPWYEKWMDRGAKKLIQQRMIKDAYVGDIFWVPFNLSVELPDGRQVPWRDLGRQISDNRMSGGAMTLPMFRDDKGNKLMEYEPPQSIAGGTDTFAWKDGLDEDILRGADIPIEVIKAQENGGFSGRSIPFMVLLSVCTGEFVEYVKQVQELLRVVAWLNFGGDPEFEMKPKSLVESFAGDAAGSPMGGGAIGGQPGQQAGGGERPGSEKPRTAWVNQSGDVTQFREEGDGEGKWITIGGRKEGDQDHAGGFPVQIDANGNILKSGGPKSLEGKNISQLREHFNQLNTRNKSDRFNQRQEESRIKSRSGWENIVKRQAARLKVSEDEYEETAKEVWQDKEDLAFAREAAKRHLRNSLGLNAGDIARLENQGFDSGSKHGRIKNLDVFGAEIAGIYPELGWGTGDSGDGVDYGSLAWDLIREGRQEIPSRTSQEYHDEIANHIVAMRKERKRQAQEAKANAEPDFDFGANVTEFDLSDSNTSTLDEIIAIGTAAARRRILTAAERIADLAKKKSDLSDPTTFEGLGKFELLADIRALLEDLHRGISSDLQSSMIASSFAGAAEVAVSVPPAHVPPITTAAPPTVPPTPPTIASFFPDDPEPGLRFPVIDDALAVLHDAEIFTSDDYREVAEQAKAGAFAITSTLGDEAVADIRDLLQENIAKGPDLEGFVDAVQERLREGGPLSERHIETIFRTNVSSSFSNGANKSLESPMVVDAFPYRAYWATTDRRVRKNHIALEKLGLQGTNIYRADDPVFIKFRPPWEFNCRCSWSPVTVEQAAKAGVVEAQEWLARAKEAAKANGGSWPEWLNKTAPMQRAWVAVPGFEPPAEFRRV